MELLNESIKIIWGEHDVSLYVKQYFKVLEMISDLNCTILKQHDEHVLKRYLLPRESIRQSLN